MLTEKTIDHFISCMKWESYDLARVKEFGLSNDEIQKLKIETKANDLDYHVTLAAIMKRLRQQ